MTLTLELGVGDGGRDRQISEVFIANSILGQLRLHSETLLKQTNKTKQHNTGLREYSSLLGRNPCEVRRQAGPYLVHGAELALPGLYSLC